MKTPPLIPWPLLVAAAVAILAAVYVSTGHASVFDYAWQKTRPAAPQPWLHVEVSDTDRVCRDQGASTMYLGRINACATWAPTHCIIYLPANAPRWLIEHEEKHCEGWTHP